ncbi:LacI family DNA-binding transcriptional regulator [Roseovarius sp. SK2]|uniref:LacI family DNA-binding transcriptional regulator n=1 Tax=Roseovarius TaxID=74030 RepID=UPI00237AB927|nr:LacI family DNA-binding transcriptional regulator [Roseovarius sp. SK2]MDD9728071.1 LacI family DNA-binding transcriptional regulator [Roseovarius sp. SK2]
MKKKTDIIAVARAARVSPSTVSRSFNHPDLVKASTRKKIDAAVRQLGYIRNRAAQTIHGIRSGTIGLIVPTVDQAIFAELIQSFSEAVENLGFTILLASHGFDLDREYALTRKMLEHRVDGVALIGIEHAQDTLELLAQQDMPTLLLWSFSPDAAFPCVGADNYQAGYLIGTHVAALGHKRVAAIFPPLGGNDRASLRFAGVTDALEAVGCTIPEAWRLVAPYSVATAKSAVEALIAEGDLPTAIVCGNDVLAWGALHALMRGGIPVPGQMTVTGIGDFNGSKEFEPSLTTVRIPARTIGGKAAEAIVRLTTSEEEVDTGALIPTEIMVRGTSGPPGKA